MTADRWAEHARRIAEALELGLDDCDPENDFSPGQVYIDAQASLAALLDELARLRALFKRYDLSPGVNRSHRTASPGRSTLPNERVWRASRGTPRAEHARRSPSVP